MTEDRPDQWASWLAQRRHGGDPERLREIQDFLAPVRDRVVAHAAVAAGQTVLDVGCGDGLIGFAAAAKVGPAGMVIFSDVSADLLDRCRQIALASGLAERCRFLQARASDLSSVADASVDAVTMRSVLIYEPAKASAFTEFHRVLRPGGRLSLFEPINRFGWATESTDRFMGWDVAPVAALAAKVRAVYEAVQPPASDPMLDFDERTLLRLAEDVGFEEVHLELQLDVDLQPPARWEVALNSSGNPRIPTLAEAMGQALSLEEAQQLSAHLRPQVERGTGRHRSALAHLWAVRQQSNAGTDYRHH